MLKSYKLRYKLQDTSYKFNQVHHSQDKADTKYQPQFCDYEMAEIKIYKCALQLAYHQEYESSPTISVVMLINARYLQASVKSQ